MKSNETLKQRNGNGEQSAVLPPRGKDTFTPRVDILETDEELTLYADLPGVRPEDLELQFEKDELVLHGKVTPRCTEEAAYQEYNSGDFRRVFRINEDIDVNNITATLRNGVLTLRLPKSERVRPRKIAVSGD
jgi:HSP20 family molecular chaperone IbpA